MSDFLIPNDHIILLIGNVLCLCGTKIESKNFIIKNFHLDPRLRDTIYLKVETQKSTSIVKIIFDVSENLISVSNVTGFSKNLNLNVEIDGDEKKIINRILNVIEFIVY